MADDKNVYGVKTVHTKSVGGLSLETHLLPAGEAVDLLPVLIALGSGPTGMILDVIRAGIQAKSVEAIEVGGAEIREGLLALARELVAQGGAKRIRQLLSHTYLLMPKAADAGHARVNLGDEFDEVFRGRPWASFEVLAWVMEVNFAPLDHAERRQGSLSRLAQWVAKSKAALGSMLKDSTSAQETGSGSESPEPGASPSESSESSGPSTTS